MNAPRFASGRCAAVVDATGRLAIAIILLVVTPACPHPNQSSEMDSGNATSSVPTTGQDGRSDGEFHWPQDDQHSIMHLEIATRDNEGTIEIELMPEFAPVSVDRLIHLTRDGHYDGTTFHRVIRGSMVQGGDPNSRDNDPTDDGQGSAAQALPDEFSPAPFVRGVVALAHRGRPDSNSSQFFILQSDRRDLDGQYTAIGRVVNGIDFVDTIANTPTDKVGRWGPKDRPIENVSIRRAFITGPGGQDLSNAPPDPVAKPQPMKLSRSDSAPGEPG